MSGNADTWADKALQEALSNRDCTIQMVLDLHMAGADLNARRADDKTTLLMQAATRDDAKVVQSLLFFGADVNLQDIEGRTALHESARFYGGEKIMRMILGKKGVNTELRDIFGCTPLISAAAFGRTELVKMLLERGAQVEARDNEGRTPLMRASGVGVITLLLAGGADMDAADIKGWTPVIFSARFGDVPTARFLIDSGAQDRRAADGRSAEDIARAYGYDEAADQIRDMFFARATRAFRAGTAEDTPVVPPLRLRKKPLPGPGGRA